MDYELTYAEKLENYRELLDVFDKLQDYKTWLVSHINTLQSPDLSKTKVMTGGRKPISSQEMYAIRLEVINNTLAEHKAAIDKETRWVLEQANRLKPSAKLLILYYYIYRMSWSEIADILFPDGADALRSVFTLRKQALDTLENYDNNGAYIPTNEQLSLLEQEQRDLDLYR